MGRLVHKDIKKSRENEELRLECHAKMCDIQSLFSQAKLIRDEIIICRRMSDIEWLRFQRIKRRKDGYFEMLRKFAHG